MKTAIVLFNLGGPDSPAAVRPFLASLFSDPAILEVPAIVRWPLAWLLAKRRTPTAQAIYAHLGGASPILEQTQAQAGALEAVLQARGIEAKCFVAMRHWHPKSDETARAVKAWGAARVVLLPLYPQFSGTTTGSSIDDWTRAARKHGLTAVTARACCYPVDPGFVAAEVDLIRAALAHIPAGQKTRLLLSAHGLPKRTVERGDPYQWQVEQSARAIVAALDMPGLDRPDLDWKVCYQSRVGPLEWIGPSTDDEIRRAGADGAALVVAPVAFVSEHSETLVELDIEYAKLARESGVPHYVRVPTVGTAPDFIAGLAHVALAALRAGMVSGCDDARTCPAQFGRCGFSAQART